MSNLNTMIRGLSNSELTAVIARDYSLSAEQESVINADFGAAFDAAIREQSERLASNWGAFADGIDPDATTYDSREAFLAAPFEDRRAMAEEVIRMNLGPSGR